MNFKETNILGNIVDPTYKDAYDSIGSFKVLPKIVAEGKLEITVMTIVNLLNRSEMQVEAKKAQDQLNKACNISLKEIKAAFKLAAGRVLKTKNVGENPSVELINMSSFSPKGTALVRNVYSFEIS
tara:strand:- start:333 stop:710 length:378 start_codon:yes stop_codon:yes gene_type:complete